jgi:uncharacterized membrane protein
MISYELVLSSSILIVIFFTGTFNFSKIIELQQSIWFIVPLLPVFIIYFISILAETSRTPFDLQEALSERSLKLDSVSLNFAIYWKNLRLSNLKVKELSIQSMT